MERPLSFLLVALFVSALILQIPQAFPASSGGSLQLTGEVLGWDAVNITWTQVNGTRAYLVYRSESFENLLADENLIAVVNWSKYPEYHRGWSYLPNETVEYNGSIWVALKLTNSPPGGEGWKRVGPVIPVNYYSDSSLEGNKTYYYAVIPLFENNKKGKPSNSLKVRTPPEPYRIVVYYISWGVYARKFYVSDIPYENVTHVLYAFLRPLENGTVTWADPWADPSNLEALGEFKKHYPAVKVLVSVGGWTLSKYFSDIAADPAKREEFANSVLRIIRRYGFDGVDVDWEYPGGGGMKSNHVRPDDGKNFVLLMKKLREVLDNAGKEDHKHYLITAAVSPNPEIAGRVNWSDAMKYIDFINVMAYDFIGLWSNCTGHNAPLYKNPTSPVPGSVDEAVRWYTSRIPPEKVVLGLPFYGRSFANVPLVNHGLFQPYNGTPDGTWGSAAETHGVMDYWDIADRVDSGTYQEFWDNYSLVPWAYSEKLGIFITYDDPRSVRIKTEYAINNTLGGVMVWEITADRKPGTAQHPLLEAILDALEEKPPAWIPDEYSLGSKAPQQFTVEEPKIGPVPASTSPPQRSTCGPSVLVLITILAAAFRKR
ncbi:MAG: chitinase [Thermococcaceae archaeon]|nr:chitinase [Thermococcaceae archaeon]MDK2913406.1 chitinase [Thermococcaceae archaeon]